MRLLLCVGLVSILVGCQSTPTQPPPLSLEEAKNVSAEFGNVGAVAPPRRIDDITAILDSQKPDDRYRASVMSLLQAEPPSNASSAALAQFYRSRSTAAMLAGMPVEALADASEAVRYARDANPDLLNVALFQLAAANNANGKPDWPVYQELYGRLRGTWSSQSPASNLATHSEEEGDLRAAATWIAVADLALAAPTTGMSLAQINWQRGVNASGHANLAMASGKSLEAEYWWRKSIAYGNEATKEFTPTTRPRGMGDLGESYWVIGNRMGSLTDVLLRQDRLLEAEVVARERLLLALQRTGRSSLDTANALGSLSVALLWQGRFEEAERLARAEAELRNVLHVPTNGAYNRVANAMAFQRRWPEAEQTYDLAGVETNRSLNLRVGPPFARIATLYEVGRLDEGFDLASANLELTENTFGAESRRLTLRRGFAAVGLSRKGDTVKAMERFRQVWAQVNGGGDRNVGRSALILEYRRYILEEYLRLLVDSSVRNDSVRDPQAFTVADALRSAAADRALLASAARAQLPNSDLADLSRREQDARQQVTARLEILTSALSQPLEQQNAAALASLREDTEKLRQAQATLSREIERRFPAYANLINPAPATVEQARAALTADEALVALYAGEYESYVWALHREGPVAFAVMRQTRAQLAEKVTRLRRALDPNATTLGEIPPFDVGLGYELYATLLKPVESGWKGAKHLVVVPSGPLAQVPFSLLVTKPIAQPKDGSGALFSGYKEVPFLAREMAISQVPSVAALVSLRARPQANAARKPFVGFGDPWFSVQQAGLAERETVAAVDTRGMTLRAAPATEKMASAKLGALPRLPDTADEVREVAMALHADPTKDVFIGRAANERQVLTMKLDDRRVVMFATHGLVPGDLDGLDQPALALSAPDVAKVEGDGLLTMDKILGLKLDADWVVLSACNTAAGAGAGAEAVSGLGRAFFYAGARALLVTNWPVETTSARKLTTTMFQRQGSDATMPRAEALRQSMLELIDGPGYVDPATGKVAASYAHPLFWAPFSLVGDGASSVH